MPDTNGPMHVSNLSTGLLSAMSRAWRWVALAVVVGAVAGAAIATLRPVEYRATARLILSGPGEVTVFGTSSVDGDPVRRLQTQLERLRQDDVLLEAVDIADADVSVDDLRDRLDVRVSAVSDALTITTGSGDAATAADLADGVAIALQRSLAADASARADRIRDELEALQVTFQARIDAIQEEMDSLPPGSDLTTLADQRDLAVIELHEARVAAEEVAVDTALLTRGAIELQTAEVPEDPATLSPLLAGLLGALVGLLIGGLLAWWWSERHPRVRSPRDPEYLLDLPLLGSAPASTVRTNGHLSSTDAGRETFEVLARQPAFATARRVWCTSVRPFDGATNATLELALAAAAEGPPTALVDLGLDDRSLTDLVLGGGGDHQTRSASASAGTVTRQLSVDSGGVLTFASIAGDGDAATVRARLVEVLDDLVGTGHRVFIHGPAVASSHHRSVTAGLADAAVVHVADRTDVGELVRARRLLSDTAVCGYVWVSSSVRAKTKAPQGPAARSYSATRHELDLA